MEDCRIKKPKKNRKKTIAISLVLLLVLSIFLYFHQIVNPIVFEVSEVKVRSLANKAVGTAVYDVIKGNALYDSLINITRNDNGDILLISSNVLQINMLSRELARAAQENLDIMGEGGVDVPLGTFSGMPVLVGRGPSINLKLIPIGSISSGFISQFTSAGINQTNHRIYLNIQSNVNIILPIASQTVETNTQILICESIIVGKVPDTYLNSNSLDEMLNLVPI